MREDRHRTQKLNRSRRKRRGSIENLTIGKGKQV